MNFHAAGGLGNLLFMHHAAYAHARENNISMLYTRGRYDTAPDRPCIEHYSKLFRHVNFVGQLPPPDFQEPHDDLTYRKIPESARCLHGYFQSWKYFNKYQTEIRDLLRFNEQDKWDRIVQMYNSVKGDKRTVCLHIRLGDNINNPVHCLQTESYYENAMKRFPGQRFIAFSDSPDIAKNYSIVKNSDVVFIDEDDPVFAFFFMSLCDDFIIPNSTLSLMAYHMRENTKDALIFYTPNWHHNNSYKLSMEDMVGKAQENTSNALYT